MPVTKDHFYSINTTQGHEISYYSMQYHTIWQFDNLTERRPMEQMKLDKYQIVQFVLLLTGYPGPESLSIHCLFVFWYFLINWDNKVLFGYVQRLVCDVASWW